MYFLAVLLWIPNSLATPRMDNPLRFAFCTAVHRATWRGVGFLREPVAFLCTLAAPLAATPSRAAPATRSLSRDASTSAQRLPMPLP